MPSPLKKWRVSRIKGNAAHHYGRVEASSADAAVRKVVQECQISDPEVLKRLVTEAPYANCDNTGWLCEGRSRSPATLQLPFGGGGWLEAGLFSQRSRRRGFG